MDIAGGIQHLAITANLPPWADTWLAIALLLLAAYLADRLTRHGLLRAISQVLLATPTRYGEVLRDLAATRRLAHVVPALVIYLGVAHVPGLPDALVEVTRDVANAYMILTVALAVSALLSALDDLYEQLNPERARQKPIKGYLQLINIIVFIVAAILGIAVLIDRSPLLLLSGLGALTAVLMLVFKDTILSFVAAVQLSSNDMLRVGDRLEMPALNADGEVIDIALHTVKVQNFDQTITTIPTWRLINEPFKNWRGMSESGGRRIKRALLIDQNSARFLTEAEQDKLRRFVLLEDYLEQKRMQLATHNQRLLEAGKDPVNSRRLTNLGTFRAYVTAYLRSHPGIRQDMSLMVRQLQPGPTGLPLEIYCFTNTTVWTEYETIQDDIFDHLYAIIGEFDLRLFQEPSGRDVAFGSGRDQATHLAPEPGSEADL